MLYADVENIHLMCTSDIDLDVFQVFLTVQQINRSVHMDSRL
jgi:hypothetical protein